MLEISIQAKGDSIPLEDWPDVAPCHDNWPYSCCLCLPLLPPWAMAEIVEVIGDRAARQQFGPTGQLKMCLATALCSPCALICCPGDLLCCCTCASQTRTRAMRMCGSR